MEETVLHITVQEGQDLKDPSTFGKMSPFALLKVFDQKLKTDSVKGAGSNPQWRKRFPIVTEKSLHNVQVTIDVLTTTTFSSAKVGTVTGTLPPFQPNVTKCRWFALRDKSGKDVGKVLLEVEWGEPNKATSAGGPTSAAAPHTAAAAAAAARAAAAAAVPAARPGAQYGGPMAAYGAPRGYGAPAAAAPVHAAAATGPPYTAMRGYGAPPAAGYAPPAQYGAARGYAPAYGAAPPRGAYNPAAAASTAPAAYAAARPVMATAAVSTPPTYAAATPAYGAAYATPYAATTATASPVYAAAAHATPTSPAPPAYATATATAPAYTASAAYGGAAVAATPPAPPASASSGPYVPTMLDNKYTDLQVLGAGNFGIAYKANNRVDDEVYAVKLIKIMREGDLADIKSEAKFLFPLVHKNIVRYFSSFLHTSSTGQLYYGLVMEYCDQGHLNDVIKKSRKENKRINDGQIGLWVYQIACALAYIHGNGVIHRDLKGDNVFLRDNIAKLADFGLAKDGAASGQAGAYAYESPEQARGLAYDGRNDVWALGCLLSELLTLKLLPERGTGAIALDHGLVGTIVKDSLTVHPELGAWVRRMMEMNPEHRPTAKQLVEELTPSVASFERRLRAPSVKLDGNVPAHIQQQAQAQAGSARSLGSARGLGAGTAPAAPAAAAAAAPRGTPPRPAPVPLIRITCNKCRSPMDCRVDTPVNLCPKCHTAIVHTPCVSCRMPLSFVKGRAALTCPACKVANDLTRLHV